MHTDMDWEKELPGICKPLLQYNQLLACSVSKPACDCIALIWELTYIIVLVQLMDSCFGNVQC